LTKRLQKVIIIQIGDSTVSEGGHYCSSTELGRIIVGIKFKKLYFVMGMDDEKFKKNNQMAALEEGYNILPELVYGGEHVSACCNGGSRAHARRCD